MFIINNSSKYHGWYKKCSEKREYVHYCRSNVLFKYKNYAKIVYMVMSFALHSSTEKYTCIDYLCFQYKTISEISSDKLFEENSYLN